jgi:4-hydroxyphenylpyruvate dioxygenase
MPCRPAICSHSLGRAWVHSLPSKLDAAARHNLDIELFYEDLEYVARALPGGSNNSVTTTPPPPEALLAAARHIRQLCDERAITIMCLQPFMHYDGLRDRARHAARIADARVWIDMALLLGTTLIAVPSTCLPAREVSGDVALLVADLRELADLGAAHGVTFAYEALCWGTHVDRWEQAWEVVQRVDRANVQICFDTFNFAGRVFGDPAAVGCVTEDAEEAMAASLQRLVRTVDVRKIAYIQVVDAEKLAAPLVEGHEFYQEEQGARMSWSRNCRLFYGETERGAYLPVYAILKTLLVDLGFEGYVSAELFNRSLTGPEASVPEEHAERAAVSWRKIVEDFGLESRKGAGSGSIVGRAVAEEGAPRAQL